VTTLSGVVTLPVFRVDLHHVVLVIPRSSLRHRDGLSGRRRVIIVGPADIRHVVVVETERSAHETVKTEDVAREL